MTEEERIRLLHIFTIIAESPSGGYMVSKGMPKGYVGCSVFSQYLGDLALKVMNGSPQQWAKLTELGEAYKNIVQDLNESYLLYMMYLSERKKKENEQFKNRELQERVKLLESEVEKMRKTINFGS